MKQATSKILIFIIIACFVGGGFLFWLTSRETRIRNQESNLPAGIEVIEQGDKKIVRNIAEGYEVKVPKEWKAQIINRGISGQNLRLRSEEVQQQIEPSEITTGCISEIFVNKNPEKLTLDQWIELNAPGGILSRENIEIGSQIPAVKIVGNELGPYIVIYTLNPRNSDIHEIVVYPNEPGVEACINNFNKMLTTYSFAFE